jgi:uncharacterized protein (TIGR03086 family)
MAQEAMPNPIDLFTKASSHAKGIVAGVKQDQLSSPTPCSEWNVKALIDHLIGGAQYLSSSLSGNPSAPGDAGGSAPSSGSNAAELAATYGSLTAEALRAAANPAALETRIETPVGEMSGGQFMGILFIDHLIHSWDLAKATGQSTRLDPELVQICYQMCAPIIIEMGRERGAFGPAVPVPDSASTQDKLLGYLGRQP